MLKVYQKQAAPGAKSGV